MKYVYFGEGKAPLKGDVQQVTVDEFSAGSWENMGVDHFDYYLLYPIIINDWGHGKGKKHIQAFRLLIPDTNGAAGRIPDEDHA